MRKMTSKTAVGISLVAALAATIGGGALAQSTQSGQGQLVQARVISANPIRDQNGSSGYNVTYEYNGREYTTRTANFPGATVPVEVSAYGVATMPVTPQSDLAPSETADGRPGWDQVVPEQGVVVSTAPRAPILAPAPVYYAAPAYAAPVYPAPVYVQPGYGYGYAPYYPPVGVSLNLGYSRGWGGGHRGWR